VEGDLPNDLAIARMLIFADKPASISSRSSKVIRVVCGLQFQPGALGVLFQQALAFQAATYTLTDQLNQARGNRSSSSLLSGALTR
jgi:hypothetical protein